METCLRMHQGWGRNTAVPALPSSVLADRPAQHGAGLVGRMVWCTPAPVHLPAVCQLPQHHVRDAMGRPAGQRQGVTHRSEPLLLRVGWLRLTSREPWGGRRRLSPTVTAWHPERPPDDCSPPRQPSSTPRGTGLHPAAAGQGALVPPRLWQEPGLQLGHPQGAGAAAGRAGCMSSADPAG